MKVKDFINTAKFLTTIAITEDNGKTIHSIDEQDKFIMKTRVISFEIRNNILVLYIDKVDRKIKCWCCNNENVIKGCKCINCGEVV